MRHLRENTVIQFSGVSFIIMASLAVLISLLLGLRLEQQANLLGEHGAAMNAGTMIPDGAPFSIPSLRQDIAGLQVVVYALTGGGFLVLYASLFPIFWRNWKRIGAQNMQLQKAYSRQAADKQDLEQLVVQLRETREQVAREERLRALGQMVSGIGHDFNNALSPISGFSELLLNDPGARTDQARIMEYAGMINTAAKDAAMVVGRLRDFYGKREPQASLEPVSMNDLVVDAISLTKAKWKDEAQAKGVTITENTENEDVPPIFANGPELRQALTNLIFNAIDAISTNGTITLRTRLEQDHITVEVSDTGVGMTEEVRIHCVDPFFTTKGTAGVGLGLATVYGVVERHQGRLEIESEPGKGTTVRIRLPGQPLAVQLPDDRAHTLEQLPPLRILVVDDEPMVRRVLADMLISDGRVVDTAAHGKEGLEKFRSGNFDLVLIDRAMPIMSGDQLATIIHEETPNTPVVMLTGFGDLMQAVDEKPPGVAVVLTKPISQNDLRKAIVQATAESGQVV